MNDENPTFDDRASAILEPDTLLPSQYFDRVRRRAARDGERRLMIAVLEDAVHAYLAHAAAEDPRRRALFDEAEAWIEDRDTTWLYSFENICAVLDLDPGYLRRGLRAHRARALGRGPAPPVEDDDGAGEDTSPLRRATA